MASYSERLELSIKRIVEHGFDTLKYPTSETLRWLLGQAMLNRELDPAAAAFRERRDRFADTDDAWAGMIESAACAAGNLALGESPVAFGRRGLAHFKKLEPGFYTSADVLELAFGLALCADDSDAAAKYREERLSDAPDMSSATASFERLYLTSPVSDGVSDDAVAWSVFRGTWAFSMLSIATYLIAPTLCVLSRFHGRKARPLELLNGRVEELDRRTHVKGERYDRKMQCELTGAEVDGEDDQTRVVLRFDIEGKGRFDGAYEECPPLSCEFIDTMTAASKLLRGKQKKALKVGLEEQGVCVDAAFHPKKGASIEDSDLDLFTRRLAVAVEHARRYKSWHIQAGSVSRNA